MKKNITDLATDKIKKELQVSQRSNQNVSKEEQVRQLCNMCTHENS
jgi:hypothetical protein